MADGYTFELVSPEKLVLSGQASEVIVPGSEGYFTVMANHAPLMSTLKPGFVEVKLEDGEQKIFVRGGFADVSPAGFTLLAEMATAADDMSTEDLDREIKAAEVRIESAGDNKVAREMAETLVNQLNEVKASM